jgi:hypothetical protein
MNTKSIGLVFFTLLVTLMSLMAQAEERRFGREEFDRRPHPDSHFHPSLGWVVPTILGGALVYEAVQNSAPPPVVMAPAPQYYPVQPSQPQMPPAGYHWAQIVDASCNCQRVVLMQNP